MCLDTNPLFRKANAPWYDGNTACAIVMAAMLVLCLFGWAGIAVARTHPSYHAYIWVPFILLMLSLLVGVSVTFRLLRRCYDRYMQTRDL
ncbi:MAG: hypothetical protein C4519_14935 [Desulfobacteraceae bacterium]|nr:MAG: hypothetical protein C4519_14935 [Desulfobacteraceae bacterium]